ncbi:MAG: retron Ec67 family RNA-directed DNA polymerase/endonuclease [Lysobacteraceae bacterium]
MSSLAKLKSAKSLSDLASLLGFNASKLAYVIYKIPESEKYTEFEVPKRNGGKRKIKAPEPRLKTVQRRLANLLYQCISEIEQTPPIRTPLSHGFSKSRSIVTNAARHKRRRHVFNIDLLDFFPTINFGRVRGCFIKDKKFELHEDVATVIAQIACHNNELPQGSPCSPVISNIIGNILDLRLVRVAKKYGCRYSRYADDITFSTNLAKFPEAIAAQDQADLAAWKAGTSLAREISKAGFSINAHKTRLQSRHSRQLTTGLVVNQKPNIRPEYYRTARSMCAALFSTGSYYYVDPTANSPKAMATSISPLEGKLCHIYHVRNSADQRSASEKKKEPTATRKLYQKFLHYKHFVALDRPLVVTEGKTDQIYLRAAIEKLTKFHPELGSISAEGKFTLSVKLMNFTSTVHDVLQLGGGAGDIKHLITQYEQILKRFKHAPLMQPVILVIDNDDGANDIFTVAKKFAPAINHASTDDFYILHKNLYLIKTPSLPTKAKTCIEDFFDATVLATKIDGKDFDPNKKHGDNTKYGKTRFAEKVIAPNKSTIDFSAFSEILDRIAKAIDHHAP